MLFSVMGWETIEAPKSKNALTFMLERHFDLAVVDLRMPELNGLELCIQVRKQLGEKAPIIFLLTGYIDHKTQTEVENSGAQTVLLKPIGLKEMQEALKKAGLPH
ncbi:MAG: response regulator [Methylacidiphilales bacterium]|nr:response regulator [Candidatus Methylacidiphilales bacterium]